MHFRLLLEALFLAGCCYLGNGLPNAHPSNILAFLPTETKSHFNGFKPLLEELVIRGHNLTLVSPYPLSSTAVDGSQLIYKYIQVETEEVKMDVGFLNKNSALNKVPLYMFVLWFGPLITRKALDKRSVRDFIANDDSPFDLVLIENFFHECFVTLGHKYSVPVVQLLPFATNPRVSHWHSNPYNPSYIADFSNNYAAPMKFWQRAENALSALFNTWINRLVYIPQQRAIMDEYFAYSGHETRPDLETMLRNISLTLVNSHPLFSPVAPYVPSYVQVAGMHVRPVKTLPKDLKSVLDNTKEGIVYLSFGSVIQSSDMSQETVSLLISELAKIKQTVLWKWEKDQLPDLPKNVIVRKWFPQNDILNHPNCRLFITHGGIHSVIESIYHGVPMLSIPVFGDQRHNSVELEQRGFALYIPFFELTVEAFGTALRRILQEPQFSEAVKRASSIMRDSQTSILDKAVFWIEHVIRQKGAPYLRTAANDLYWYQYYLLDVIAVAFLALAFISYLNYKCFMYLLKKMCARKSTVAVSVSKGK